MSRTFSGDTVVDHIDSRHPTSALPDEEASEPGVEDASPDTNTTTDEETPPAAKDDDGELPYRSEDSVEGKVPYQSEDSKDDSDAPAGRRPGEIINAMKETMKEMGENLVQTGPSA